LNALVDRTLVFLARTFWRPPWSLVKHLDGSVELSWSILLHAINSRYLTCHSQTMWLWLLSWHHVHAH